MADCNRFDSSGSKYSNKSLFDVYTLCNGFFNMRANYITDTNINHKNIMSH